MMDPILNATDLHLAEQRRTGQQKPRRWPWRGGRWAAPEWWIEGSGKR